MYKKKYKRKKKLATAYKSILAIKRGVPKIIFRARNLVVTLKNKNQLDKWLSLYPEGTYTINH
jgi:hypothetical protein